MCGSITTTSAGCAQPGSGNVTPTAAGNAQISTTTPAATSTQGGGGSQARTGAGSLGSWSSNARFVATSSMTMNHHGSMGLMTRYERSGEDRALATRVMTASLDLLAPLPMSATQGASGKPDNDHRKVPDSVKQQWAAKYPDLPVPNIVVYDKHSGRAVGALFVGGAKAKDLGKGDAHQHEAGGAVMQHMWFVPGNLDLAFSDTLQKPVAIQAALAR